VLLCAVVCRVRFYVQGTPRGGGVGGGVCGPPNTAP